MQLHGNAKLGLRGRLELVLAIERGMSLATAHRSISCARRGADTSLLWATCLSALALEFWLLCRRCA